MMNQANFRRAGWVAQIAVCVATAGMYLPAHAYTSGPGGTITFQGMLIAPQFDVATQTATVSGYGTQNAMANGDEHAATVTFNAPAASAPSARVFVDAKAENAVTTRFVDGRGRTVAPARDGTYHVGETGGTLSMTGNKAVTLVTAYN